MKNSKLSVVEQPQQIETDPLSALLRSGARALIAQAVAGTGETVFLNRVAQYFMNYRQGNLKQIDAIAKY